jgi:hypothetical protein
LHSWSFTPVRTVVSEPSYPRSERPRTSPNPKTNSWKACWGQPLTSSNLVSSATAEQAKRGPRTAERPGFSVSLGLSPGLIYFRHKRHFTSIVPPPGDGAAGRAFTQKRHSPRQGSSVPRDETFWSVQGLLPVPQTSGTRPGEVSPSASPVDRLWPRGSVAWRPVSLNGCSQLARMLCTRRSRVR